MTDTYNPASDLHEQEVLRHALQGLQHGIDAVDDAVVLIDPMPKTVEHWLALKVLGDIRKQLGYAQGRINLTLTAITADTTTVL